MRPSWSARTRARRRPARVSRRFGRGPVHGRAPTPKMPTAAADVAAGRSVKAVSAVEVSSAPDAAARRGARRRPDPLPAGGFRVPRAAGARRARRPDRAARGRSDAPCRARVGDGLERRQGVGRRRPEGRARLRPRALRPRGRRARGVPPRRRGAARRRAGRRAGVGRLLLDHGLRHGRAPREARGARPQLPRLGRACWRTPRRGCRPFSPQTSPRAPWERSRPCSPRCSSGRAPAVARG